MEKMRDYPLRISETLFTQVEKYIEIHEKKTGLSLSKADFFRIAISEKLLRR